MKTCEIISGFYLPDGRPAVAGTFVDLPDELADERYAQGMVDIVSHDGVEVGYAACCSAHGHGPA